MSAPPATIAQTIASLPREVFRLVLERDASEAATAGNTAYAYNFNGPGTTTVNGVNFTGLNGALASSETPPNFTTTGFNNNYNGYGGGPANYNNLLSNGIYGDTTSGTGAAGITLGNSASPNKHTSTGVPPRLRSVVRIAIYRRP